MKKEVLIDYDVICQPSYDVLRFAKTLEEQAKMLDEWCVEFNAFVYDHRSQYPLEMRVERKYQDQCSYCGNKWETDDHGCPTCCEDAQDEWGTTQ